MKAADLKFSTAKIDAKPGDVIMIAFSSTELDQTALNDIRARLARQFPDNCVMVTAGLTPPEIKICRVEWQKGEVI